jgi:hypothetical protein
MTKILDQGRLQEIVCAVGYRKATDTSYDADAPYVYRYGASNAVIEHFIYFHETSDGGVSGDFGIRNNAAHEFSFQMLTRHGGPLYSSLTERMSQIHTFLRFQLSNFIDPTGLFHWDARALFGLQGFLEKNLLPFVDSVQNPTDLLTVLVSDNWPCPWRKTNCAARAAQVSFFASALRKREEFVLDVLTPKAKLIKNSLSNDVEAADYISSIMRESFPYLG